MKKLLLLLLFPVLASAQVELNTNVQLGGNNAFTITPITNGGTGATTAGSALTNLGGQSNLGVSIIGGVATFPNPIVTPAISGVISALGYGAICDGNNTHAAADLAGVQPATNAAIAIYTATGNPVGVQLLCK